MLGYRRAPARLCSQEIARGLLLTPGLGCERQAPGRLSRAQCVHFVQTKRKIKARSQKTRTLKAVFKNFMAYINRGSTVVKVLCYKSEGRWFEPSWCQWIFH